MATRIRLPQEGEVPDPGCRKVFLHWMCKPCVIMPRNLCGVTQVTRVVRMCWPGIPVQPFLLDNVGDSVGSEVRCLFQFQPPCCRINHGYTSAWEVSVSFATDLVWSNSVHT
jgi:hypothetical protein